MRQLLKMSFLKKQIASQLDADGIYDDCTKKMGICKGLEWDNEMDTLVHEYLHFLFSKYPTRMKKLNDVEDLKKNETDRMAKKICRMLVLERYKKLFE